MKMFDIKHGHYVAELANDVIISRHGCKFTVQGCAVVDEADEVVGTFIDGVFANRLGKRMAIVEGAFA